MCRDSTFARPFRNGAGRSSDVGSNSGSVDEWFKLFGWHEFFSIYLDYPRLCQVLFAAEHLTRWSIIRRTR